MTEATPAPVWELINGYGAYWALSAAVELGLFDRLADGACTSRELAAATGIGDDGDLVLLAEVLASHGLLATDRVRWALTPVARRFLVSSSPASMVDLVRYSPGPHAAWPALASTLRAGHPAPDTVADLDRLYPPLVAATAGTQAAVAAGVAAGLGEAGISDLRAAVVVDFGCGSGAWLDALLTAAGPDARGVGVDRANVLSVAKERLAGHRIDYVTGDYLDVDLPVEHADVVVLAHVLRAEPAGRAQVLVERALRLLGDHGILLVADYFRPDEGASEQVHIAARHALALSLTMRASTAGRGITERCVDEWCAASGAQRAAVLEPVPRQRVHVYIPGGSR